MQQIQQECLDEIEQAYLTAEAHYSRPIKRVPVRFSNKLTRAAGKARFTYTKSTGECEPTGITLSIPILRMNPAEFISSTPAHEAAHVIALELFNDKTHGRVWKRIMGIIGKKADRCHEMITPPKRKTKEYRYIASCGTVVMLKSGRHNKILKGSTYRLKHGGHLGRAQYTPLADTTAPTMEGWHYAGPKTTKPAKKAKAKPAKKVTKASIVRECIARHKASDIGLQDVILSNLLLGAIAKAANLEYNLCKKYVKNLWEAV